MNNFLKLLHQYRLIWIGSAIGAVAGYIYWLKIGCVSGSCPITGKPLNATLYGAFLFGLLFDNFRTKPKKENN